MKSKLLGLVFSALLAGPMIANASVIINITELAGNVNVNINGSLNLTGATFSHQQSYSTGIIPGGSNWYIAAGTTPGLDWYTLSAVTLPFGTSGVYFSPPTSTSGNGFSIWGFAGGTPLVGVESGYTSGTAISAQMLFAGQSLAAMTLMTGSYLFSLPQDTITLNIGGVRPPTGVPEPASLTLVGLGLIGLAARRRKQK